MAFELKPGQGALHKNDKEGVETRPDYTGSINIDGTMYRLSAWLKQGKSAKWMSLNAEIPKPKAALESKPDAPPTIHPDDAIPF